MSKITNLIYFRSIWFGLIHYTPISKLNINLLQNLYYMASDFKIFQKRRYVFLIIFFITLFPNILSAQDVNPFQFEISIAPNSSGSIDGYAKIIYNWNDWINSSVEVISKGFAQEIFENNVNKNVLVNSRNLNMNVISINQNLLWHLLMKQVDQLKFSIGIIGQGAIINTKEHGYIDSDSSSFYFEDSTQSYIRPLINTSASLLFRTVRINGYGIFTPLITYDITKGSYVSSAAPLNSPFENSGIGYNGEYGASIALDLKGITPSFSLDYSIHTGVTQSYKDDTSLVFIKQRQEWCVSALCGLRFIKTGFGYPIIGISWLFNKVDAINYPEFTFENQRYRISIGINM